MSERLGLRSAAWLAAAFLLATSPASGQAPSSSSSPRCAAVPEGGLVVDRGAAPQIIVGEHDVLVAHRSRARADESGPRSVVRRLTLPLSASQIVYEGDASHEGGIFTGARLLRVGARTAAVAWTNDLIAGAGGQVFDAELVVPTAPELGLRVHVDANAVQGGVTVASHGDTVFLALQTPDGGPSDLLRVLRLSGGRSSETSWPITMELHDLRIVPASETRAAIYFRGAEERHVRLDLDTSAARAFGAPVAATEAEQRGPSLSVVGRRAQRHVVSILADGTRRTVAGLPPELRWPRLASADGHAVAVYVAGRGSSSRLYAHALDAELRRGVGSAHPISESRASVRAVAVDSYGGRAAIAWVAQRRGQRPELRVAQLRCSTTAARR